MKKTIKFHTIAVMNGKEIDLEDAVNGVANENLKLNKRIDKAIEYIKSYNLPDDLGKLSECPISVSDLKELLNILRGEDNE